MAMSESAKNYQDKMFPGYVPDFLRTDTDYIEMSDNFAFDEVVNTGNLPDKDRFMAILATLVGSSSVDEFCGMMTAAMNFGVTPVEIKEIVCQPTACVGIGRTFPFLKAVNGIMEARGVKLPLEAQAVTTPENRMDKGQEALVRICGDQMEGFWDKGDDANFLNVWLTDNCFGDYYTRQGLDDKQREMITFCFLLGQGGCDNQLRGHIANNINVGNDRAYLLDVIGQVMLFIGSPRTLNVLSSLNKLTK